MSAPSLASRAVTALALTIGFYLFAIAIAAGLLAIPYFEVTFFHRIYGRLTVACIVGGLAILWSILPRFDRFVAPGPQLTEKAQPQLFAALRDIAKATQQQMPREVYLINDVNAWVAQRGGFAGIGSRRVMGLGLPLMQSLTLSQFRAVVAHEFGHYHGGDTSLGPWIYKTREAIGRTVRNLAASGGALHAPFLWYGNFFMRITQAISRAQELAADRLAATVAGAKNAAKALVAVEGASVAFDSYWRGEVLPLLSNGYHAPIAAGFKQFMNAGIISEAVQLTVEEAMTKGSSNEFDSHPPLRERVAALKDLPQGNVVEDEAHAVTLLRGVGILERDLLRSLLIDPTLADRLKNVAWTDTGSTIYLPNWREAAKKNANALRDLTFADLPRIVDTLPAFAKKVVSDHENEQPLDSAKRILGSALSTALADAGWVCDASPGNNISFALNGRKIEPFSLIPRLLERELTAEAWISECQEAGIAGLRLV